MRVVEVQSEDERARQADHRHEAGGGRHRHAGHRPEVRARISERQRSQMCDATFRAGLSHETREHGAEGVDQVEECRALCPTSWTREEAMPAPTMRSRGTRMTATGFSPPPGRRVRARRMAAPWPRSRQHYSAAPRNNQAARGRPPPPRRVRPATRRTRVRCAARGRRRRRSNCASTALKRRRRTVNRPWASAGCIPSFALPASLMNRRTSSLSERRPRER